MDPLSVLGAVAIGAAGACLATDCTEAKQPPPVTLVQRADATALPQPPACSPVEPVSVSCAPQQSVNVSPSIPPSGQPKVTVRPPKVDVRVACPETRCSCPAGGGQSMTVTNDLRREKNDRSRPRVLQVNLWAWGTAVFGTEPGLPRAPDKWEALSLLLSLALTIGIPITASINFEVGCRWWRRKPKAGR